MIAAIEPSYPPFDYIKDNEITGFEVDVFNLFCTEYGYVPEYRIVQFAGILSGVSSGMFDVGAATLTITEERKNAGYFGKPFFMTPVSLIERDETKENKLTGFFDSLKEKFVGTFITEDRWKMFLAGTLVTFRIMLFSLIGGTVLGFLVFCVTRNGGRISGRITEFCKWLIRGFPEVVFLMILYYIVFAGAETSGETVAVIGFGLIFACSMHSMLVMGEATVDIGQKEAAYSLGYGNFMTFLRFILPQSAMHFMPSYISEVVSLIKATAVVGYIAIVDVTRVGDLIRGRTYEAFVPLIAVSVVYFVMAFLMKLVLKAFVRKIDTRRRSDEAVLKGLDIK